MVMNGQTALLMLLTIGAKANLTTPWELRAVQSSTQGMGKIGVQKYKCRFNIRVEGIGMMKCAQLLKVMYAKSQGTGNAQQNKQPTTRKVKYERCKRVHDCLLLP